MGNKSFLADEARRNERRTILIIALLVSVAVALVGVWMLYGNIMMRPALARSLGLLGPLTTETESPRLLEGYIYRNFEVSTFVPCEEFTGDRFGYDTYSLRWEDPKFEILLQKLADSQGKKITFGITTFVRFTGQRSWLKNAQVFEGFGNNGMYKKGVVILDLLELQSENDQCRK